jgi:hypothetical protein
MWPYVTPSWQQDPFQSFRNEEAIQKSRKREDRYKRSYVTSEKKGKGSIKKFLAFYGT